MEVQVRNRPPVDLHIPVMNTSIYNKIIDRW